MQLTKWLVWAGVALAVALGQSAIAQQLLPNGEQQFADANGAPYAAGQVFFYVPNTTTFKTTWSTQSLSSANTNPVILDAAGRAVIWGVGTYREVLKDLNGNIIWDQLTSGSGSSVSSEPIPETGNFTVVAGNSYWVNTGSLVTATLASSPGLNDSFTVKDYTCQAGTNPITIGLSGNNFEGSTVNPTIYVNCGWISAQWTGTQWVQMP